MNINGTGMSIERRQFLRRTLQAAAATQLGWAAACAEARSPVARGAGSHPNQTTNKGSGPSSGWGASPFRPRQMRDMQAGAYILHARGGALNRVPVEKALSAARPPGPRADGGTGQGSRRNRLRQPEYSDVPVPGWRAQLGGQPASEKHGRHLSNSEPTGPSLPSRTREKRTPPESWCGAQSDQGRTWSRLSEIGNPAKCERRFPGTLARLPDDTLVVPVESRAHMIDPAYVHSSSDGGRTWSGPTGFNTETGFLGGHCYETMIAPMASGKLIAVIRYHGAVVPQWPLVDPARRAYYKTVFLADSDDGGKTWDRFRQLTNYHGQCHGYGVGLSDGTFMVAYDHRYPRDLSSGRAMISRDEGETWEDEVYYLYYGDGVSGFSQSLALDDGSILTVGGISHELEGRRSWAGASGQVRAVGHSLETGPGLRVGQHRGSSAKGKKGYPRRHTKNDEGPPSEDDSAASAVQTARQAGARPLEEQERLEEAPPGSAGVPPACTPVR